MLNTERTLDCILEDETAISVNTEVIFSWISRAVKAWKIFCPFLSMPTFFGFFPFFLLPSFFLPVLPCSLSSSLIMLPSYLRASSTKSEIIYFSFDSQKISTEFKSHLPSHQLQNHFQIRTYTLKSLWFGALIINLLYTWPWKPQNLDLLPWILFRITFLIIFEAFKLRWSLLGISESFFKMPGLSKNSYRREPGQVLKKRKLRN